MPTQRSFVLIKPDAVRRGLAGAIISRFESKGLLIVAMELRQMTGELADQLYASMSSGPSTHRYGCSYIRPRGGDDR